MCPLYFIKYLGFFFIFHGYNSVDDVYFWIIFLEVLS